MAERGRPWKRGDLVTFHGVVSADENAANWLVSVEAEAVADRRALSAAFGVPADALVHRTGPAKQEPRDDQVWVPLPMSLRAAGAIIAAMAEEWPGCLIVGDHGRDGNWVLLQKAPAGIPDVRE